MICNLSILIRIHHKFKFHCPCSSNARNLYYDFRMSFDGVVICPIFFLGSKCNEHFKDRPRNLNISFVIVSPGDVV